MILNPPSLLQLPGKDGFSISAGYEFVPGDDEVVPIQVPGRIGTALGTQYAINSSTIQGVQNLPPFRTLFVNATFYTLQSLISGPIFIYSIITGQIIMLGPNSNDYNMADGNEIVLSATLPLIPSQVLDLRVINFQSQHIPEVTNASISLNVTTKDFGPYVLKSAWL